MRTVVRSATLAAVLAAAVAGGAAAQQNRPAPAPLPPNGWRVDVNHSGVTFRVRHLGISWVNGQFRDWTAELVYDPDHPEASSVSARIQVTSIDTDNERRDADLRSSHFFAADSFPEMTFTSSRVERVDASHLRVTGDLAMHGVTRPVVLDVEVTPIITQQRGRRVAFSATTTVDRKDWGMTFSSLAEGVRVAGDEVRITLDIEAIQPNPS